MDENIELPPQNVENGQRNSVNAYCATAEARP